MTPPNTATPAAPARDFELEAEAEVEAIAPTEARPASIYDEYDCNLEADVDFANGLRLHLLSDSHPLLKKLRARQLKQYRHHFVSGQVPEHIERKIELEKISVACTGWTGATDRAGEPLPFSLGNLLAVMTDLPELRKDALLAVSSREAFRKESQKLLGEVSAPRS